MATTNEAEVVFREGDEVVLDKGTYRGTPGVFLRLREDVNWADIRELDGRIRMHPVAWLKPPWVRPGCIEMAPAAALPQ